MVADAERVAHGEAPMMPSDADTLEAPDRECICLVTWACSSCTLPEYVIAKSTLSCTFPRSAAVESTFRSIASRCADNRTNNS
jgi:hypothetical protein